MPTGWAIVIVVQWLAIAALTIVVLGVLRQMASLLERAAARPRDADSAAGGRGRDQAADVC